MDCNPATGDCWVTDNGSFGPGFFNRINPSTGAATVLTSPSADIEGLAYAPGGTSGYVYGVGENNLLRYDIAGNSWSTIGAIGFTVDESGLGYDPVGQVLYMVLGNAVGGGTPGSLYTVNTTTGAATLVGATGLGTSSYGLTWVAAGPTPSGVVISDTTPVPVRYASEINATTGSPVTLANGAGTLNLSTALGYSFSQGEVRYARVECPASVRFLAGSTVVASDDPASTLGSINGLGGSVITFSITADTSALTATDSITVTGDRSITAAVDANCSFSLYDNPSEAQTGGTNGRILSRSGAYLSFGPSYALRVDSSGRATADVEGAEGVFTRFTSVAPTNDATLGQLGGFSYGTVQALGAAAQPLSAAGVPVTLTDLMDATTALVFAGDFEAADDVFLSNGANCATTVASADSFDAESATFTVGDAPALARFLCYRAGTAEIPVASYTVQLTAVAASAAYSVSNRGPLALGEIVRNGTDLMAPLVQMPAGYISRIVLTNTSSEKRDFTLRLLDSASASASEVSSSYVGLTSSDGQIPANGAIVINLADAFPLDRFQGPARAAIRAIVSGRSDQIQGLYQIVDPQRGTISNHVMVRPGTN